MHCAALFYILFVLVWCFYICLVRLIIYKIKNNSTFEMLNEAKMTMRLGGYLTEEDYLVDEGLNILLNVLEDFKDICKRYEVLNIYVVATEAVRRAVNKNDVCKKIKLELGLKVNILSGLEEAKYGYLAVKNTMKEKNAILLDLGGSSMEITLMENGEFKNTISLPLGSIPLTEIELSKFIYEKLEEIKWLRRNNNLNIVGIGGIAKHIGRVSKGDEDYQKELLHNYSITKDEISKIYDKLLKLPIDKRDNLKGLSKKRSEIFASPLGAILLILKYFNSEKFIISAIGLREGIIYENL